jgi:hypothetical protein
MDYQLKPYPRIHLRLGILAVFMLPLLLSTVSLLAKAFAFVFWTLLIGSYRQAFLREDRFEQHYFIGFVPLKVYKWRLKKLEALGLDTEEPVGCLWIIVLGVAMVLTFRVFDWLFPWVGGRYRIWLLTQSEKRILAWQGNSEETLHETLAQFEQATGMKCQRTNFNR